MSSRVYPLSAPSVAERVEATKGTHRKVHVWVDEDRPGIVVSWRRGEGGGWLAQVAYIESTGRLVVEWRPVEQVRPA